MKTINTAMQTLQQMLRESLWAQALGADELDRVARVAFERRVGLGGYAVRQGEPADCWIGVIDGLAKMSVSQPDGRVATLTGVTAGGWFGEGSLLQACRWRYDAVAVRETRLACVPRHAFEQLLSSSVAFNRFLLKQLNARLSLFIGLVEFDRLLGPDARVARCLASLFDPALYPRTSSFLRLSQEEIGLLAAVSRQRANAALHELAARGLLRVEFGGVTVLDLPGLRTYCDDAGVPRAATRCVKTPDPTMTAAPGSAAISGMRKVLP